MVGYTLEERFAKWACDRLTEDADFGKKNIFSDEAHFDLGGYVNNQYFRIWGTENPQAYILCLMRIFDQRYNWVIFLRK